MHSVRWSYSEDTDVPPSGYRTCYRLIHSPLFPHLHISSQMREKQPGLPPSQAVQRGRTRRLCKLRPEARSPLGPVLFPSSAEFLAAARSQAGPLLSRNHTARRQQPQAGKRSKQTMAGFLVLLPFSHDLDPKTLLSGLSHKALQNKLLPFFFLNKRETKEKIIIITSNQRLWKETVIQTHTAACDHK